MDRKKPNPEILWDFESGKLEIIFWYPDVETRIVREIKNKKGEVVENELNGSSRIADKAMTKHFRQGFSEIRWEYSGNDGFFFIHLTFDNKSKRMPFDKLTKKINSFDQQIRKEIHYLINPPYKSE